ncbi:aKG-HExxH-type peptide beta-hydroxylase [Tabrizicola soli]|uniref:HEXXH motif-containing putative peptide modification protein n=1 Tax=Tabrizicola soli TaxID=2185115 RepID=A0ABV7DWK6_9RHOB|nr:HEXXH motif-containing putative peptide modification protein [Tabrizicola soli]
MPSYSIEPSAQRARLLDDRMRTQLGESLGVLIDCFDPQDFPEVKELAGFIAALEQGYDPSPSDYARHYQLATATLAEDVDTVRTVLSGFAVDTAADRHFLTRWSDTSKTLLQDMAVDRFGSVASLFNAVDPAIFAAFRTRLADGLGFLDRCWPEMAAEVSVLVKQVLVATGSQSATEHFDGGSHYQLWGMLILNPAFHRTPLAVAEVLVHEASHLLLFGFTTDEPLVLNPEADRYPSPLRRDPRPMDGIYHAAYVSARMALTMHRVATSATLGDDIRQEARRLRDEDIANFQKGADVVRAHARFTATGLAIFTNAEQAVRDLTKSISRDLHHG